MTDYLKTATELEELAKHASMAARSLRLIYDRPRPAHRSNRKRKLSQAALASIRKAQLKRWAKWRRENGK